MLSAIQEGWREKKSVITIVSDWKAYSAAVWPLTFLTKTKKEILWKERENIKALLALDLQNKGYKMSYVKV